MGPAERAGAHLPNATRVVVGLELADAAHLKALLGRHTASARKAFSQNFLISSRVVKAMVAATGDWVSALEIGPGPGVLTKALTESGLNVRAIELDADMLPLLAESAPQAQVLQSDATQVDLSAELASLPAPTGLISNLPYAVTGYFLGALPDLQTKLPGAILMMQREVADRVMAEPGNRLRGSISVALQSTFVIRRLVQVPPGAFLPPPKVSSTVLEFRPVSRRPSDQFFQLVRAGFQQPRKTLANNLRSLVSGETLNAFFDHAQLSTTVRPHELTLEHWETLDDFLR